MGLQIEDGKGSGKSAQVNSDNLLLTKAVVEPNLEWISAEKGLTFTWNSGTYDGAAGDTVLLIKNTSATQDLHIHKIYMSVDVESVATIHIPTVVTTPTGTAVTGTNLNRTSANVAEATAIRDETTNSQDVIIWEGELQAATNPYEVDLQGAVVLGTNDSVAVDYVADFAACRVTIVGHYE